MGKTLEQQIAELKMPSQETNMFAAIGATIPSAIIGVEAFIKNKKAKTDLKNQQGYVDKLMQNYMNTPIYNPYDNLSVATQANQIKMDETDKALANTLDTLRQTGAAAGGATALAQAALKSKAGIAADIEKQEVGNERLRAQGEIMVQNAEMQRKGQQMDYEQSKADQLRTEQFAYGERAADMAGALGSLGLQVARGLETNKDQAETSGTYAIGNDPNMTEDQLSKLRTGNSDSGENTIEQTLNNPAQSSNLLPSKQSVTNEQLQEAEDNQRRLRQQRAIQDRQIDQTINPNNKPLGSGFNNPSSAQTPVKRSLQYMIDNPNEFNPMAAMRGEYGVELQNHYRPTRDSSVTGIK